MKIENCLSDCFHNPLPNMSEKQRERFSRDICTNPEILRLFGKTFVYQGASSDQALNANLYQQPLSFSRSF